MDAAVLRAFESELSKLAEPELSREEALAKAEELRTAIKKRLNVTPYLSGSMATGLNLPGKYDYDYGVRVTSLPKFQKLVSRLERAKDIRPSPYNKPGTDYHVFSGSLGGQDIDLALMYGDKGKMTREALNNAKQKVESMDPQQREKILKTKARLKTLSGLPVVGGAAHSYLEKPWKRKLDSELGMVRLKKDKLPELTKEGRSLTALEEKRLNRSNIYGHRTDNLEPLIGSGEILSAAGAAKRGFLRTVETSNPFSRGRSELKGPAKLRAEVFVTKGLLPADSTYGRYGVLFEKKKVDKSRYLNLIPEEHTTDRVKGRSMTFVVPDPELESWSERFPDRKIISESMVPDQKRLPAKSLGALATRFTSVPRIFQKTELV